MLNVHRYSTILKPGGVGRDEEGGDAVAVAGLAATCGRRSGRAVALWMPVFQVFSPLMIHSSPSRTAVVSMWVASEPCSGSVMPKAKPSPAMRPGRRPTRPSALRCRSVIISSRPTLLPTIECSFWRSLCRPRPLRARCSRMMAMPRLVPFCRRTPRAADSGSGRPRRPGAWPRGAAASHSSLGSPPRSQSVRASSRRWSKKRMLSLLFSSGLIFVLDEVVEVVE